MFSFKSTKTIRTELVEVCLRHFDKLSANGLFFAIVLCLVGFSALAQAQNIGRAATANEIKAWDIDVRPDFKGLPKGAGSVSLGEKVWEAQCASCHGTFGESNSVFFQLVGYTTKKDVERGNVASLQLGNDAPARTMTMKLPTISTLWDYINRAMPWNAPKSLTADEVYGVTAFLMNLAHVVPDDFVLSDQNIALVQKRLPNRNGMTTKHAMWPGKELNGLDGLKAKPDTQGSLCMKNCATEVKVSSSIPAYAMNAHGNLAEQNRTWTSVVGIDTSKPTAPQASPAVAVKADALQANPQAASRAAPVRTEPVEVSSNSLRQAQAERAGNVLTSKEIMPLLQKSACLACHAVNNKVLGPPFKEVAKKYATRSDAVSYLAEKIKSGGVGVWGSIPMPAGNTTEAESRKIAQWLAQGRLD